MQNKTMGDWGEAQAADYLRRQGYAILDRNWHCRAGELDIVARRSREIIFVEVKTRSTLDYGSPAEAVTRTKQARMRKAGEWYLRQHHLEYMPYRFDVMEVFVHHIPSAF